MASGLPKWVSELLDKGEKLEVCLELLKNMQATEREDRAAEREMRKIEMEREVKLRELEIREKELAHGNVQPYSTPNLKSKLPKFYEGQDPDVFLKSFEKLAALHKIPKLEWALRLVPLLCGKALEAFSRLPDEDSMTKLKLLFCLDMSLLLRHIGKSSETQVSFKMNHLRNLLFD